MRKIWAKRRNEEAVSPVIATILMVAITVVLAAVLYVLVLALIPAEPKIGAIVLDQGGTSKNWTLKVVGITGAAQAPLTDVYILVQNPDSSVGLSSRALSELTPGEYFNGVRYIDAMVADNINVGDSLTLDKALYESGTTVSLFDSAGTAIYAEKAL